MENAYNREGQELLQSIASELNLNLHSGIYLGLAGPNYETPAEYRMANILGADIIGMSTVPEIIAASHCGLKMNALSVISNMFSAGGKEKNATEMEAVLDRVENSLPQLKELIRIFIQRA